MATVIQNFIYMAFDRHIKGGHNADFEVCADEICRQAVELEDAMTLDWESIIDIIKRPAEKITHPQLHARFVDYVSYFKPRCNDKLMPFPEPDGRIFVIRETKK